MQQITPAHRGRDGEASRRPGRGGWEGVCRGVTEGVGEMEKTLFVRKDLDRSQGNESFH